MPPSDSPGTTVPHGPRLAFVRLACGLSSLLALAALYGWIADMPTLRSIVPGAMAMTANMALGLLLSASALWLLTLRPRPLTRRSARTLAAAAAAVGLLTLCAHALRWVPGLVPLPGSVSTAWQQARLHMTPFIALALAALGLAIAALPSRRWQRVAGPAAIVVTAIGVLSCMGDLCNVREIAADPVPTARGLHTCWTLLLMGAATGLMGCAWHTQAPSRLRSRIETLVLGGFIPCAVLAVMGAGVIYTNSARFAETTRDIERAQTMRAELATLYGALADAELARRNQMLTQQAQFDHAFQHYVRVARRGLAVVQQHAHTVSQPRQLRVLSDLVDTHLQTLHSMGTPVLDGAQISARHALLVEDSAAAMAQIRSRIQELDGVVQSRVARGVQQAQSHRRTTLLALAATLAALAALFLLLFRGIQKEVQARGEAEQRLQSLNAELEQRVAQRTAALRHQRAFLRRVIDLNHNLIFAKDLDGRFVLANHAMAQFYGTTVEVLVGRCEHEFNTDADQIRRFMATDRQVIEDDQELFIAQEQVRDAQGELRWFSTIKRPLLALDGRTLLLGVATDITARKASADELRQMAASLELRVVERTQALQQANTQLQASRREADAASRSKSAFLATMSHEIRTPMNAIIGLTHLLTRDTRDRLQRERLDKVGSAAQHLLQIINNILDISKIEAGKLTLEDTEFALDTLLQRAVTLVAETASAKGLELIVQSGALPRRLRGDPTRLSQILINLLSNAVKFTATGWVRLRGQVLREQDDRVLLHFEVQDTGPGIAAQHQSALFEAFEQGDNSASRQHGGTGLGLSLSRQLARAMGGDVGLHSAPGSGSSFWYPAWLGRQADAPRATDQAAWQDRRVLMVDAPAAAPDALTGQLAALGLQVDTVTSGASAVRKVEAGMAARSTYDLVLIGAGMPAGAGVATLTSLRAMLGAGMPPCLRVSPSPALPAQRADTDPRFDAVLCPPLDNHALQDQLAKWLQAPAGAAPDEDAAPDPASSNALLLQRRHTGQRILLAEDNPVNREVAQDLLERVGLIVETAWDGGRAVEMATSRQYDLILMDMQMPVLDGLEATQAIRQAAGQSIAIVAVTANAFGDDRRACLNAGMNDHLGKPVNPDLLYAKLLRWLPLRETRSSGLVALLEQPAHGAEDRAPLTERLARIAGLDVDAGLRNVAGQAAILERVLARFVETYSLGLPELLDASGTATEVRVRWAKVGHSVRGALEAVGAPALLAQLMAFEQQLRRGAAPQALAPQAEHLHRALRDLVRRLAAEIGP